MDEDVKKEKKGVWWIKLQVVYESHDEEMNHKTAVAQRDYFNMRAHLGGE